MRYKFKKKHLRRAFPAGLTFILIILCIITFEVIFENKFFPRTYLGDSNLTFLTKTQGYQLIDGRIAQRLQSKLDLNLNGEKYTVDLSNASAKIKSDKAINEAFEIGRSGPWLKKISQQLSLIIFGKIIIPETSISLEDQAEKIDREIYQKPKDAAIEIKNSTPAEIVITEGRDGLELDKEGLKKLLTDYIIFGESSDTLPVKVVSPKITTQRASLAKMYLEDVSLEPIKLEFNKEVWVVDSRTLLSLLNLENSGGLIDTEKVKNYLSGASETINQPVQEGQFDFDPVNSRVTEFKPSQEGRELDIEKTITLISLAMEEKRARNISLPVNVTKPKIQTEDVNDLGIKELLGRGISHFAGSIPNRIYNVNLTASRINGVLIPPGEIFSFNSTIGEVSATTGYKQAYVIKSGRTVLDDGGGVCQDSTTLFRAVLNAGLPVLSRTAHAYRVGYYEQGFPPGLDATVFAPSVDFRFKNDTPAHILIQAYTLGTTLYVDLYGTSDGRISTISKPVILNSTPPPPEVRQDDPTLAKGEVKQVEYSAWGANVTFTRTVTRNGETLINETFKSSYKPWAPLFLVGTKEN